MANDDIRSTDETEARIAAASASADPVGEIKGEIERTQASLADTVAAIQQKLSPANIVDRAKSAARESARSTFDNLATTSRAVASTTARRAEVVADRARYRLHAQPAPAVLIGAGVASLLWRLYGTRSRPDGRDPSRRAASRRRR
jgi:hypothetical protein